MQDPVDPSAEELAKSYLPKLIEIFNQPARDAELVRRLTEAENAQTQLAQIHARLDTLPPLEQCVLIAQLMGVDEREAVLVRQPDGKVTMQKVSQSAKDTIDRMARQGFSAVTFTNRKARRAAEATRRREMKRSASGG
jgi:hypothetical protein